MNWRVRVLKPVEVLDHYGKSYQCTAIGRRAQMSPEDAMKAASAGLVEILSPAGVQAYQAAQLESAKASQEKAAKRTYNRRDVQADGPLN